MPTNMSGSISRITAALMTSVDHACRDLQIAAAFQKDRDRQQLQQKTLHTPTNPMSASCRCKSPVVASSCGLREPNQVGLERYVRALGASGVSIVRWTVEGESLLRVLACSS